MAWGLVARADNGGLATQTYEFWRHLKPAKVLLVDLGPKGRGTFHASRFDGHSEKRVCVGYPGRADLDWLLEGVKTVYTAEVTYGPLLPTLCAQHEVRLVIHANPELWDEKECRGPTTQVIVPTSWEQDRVPNCSMMPVPVARDVIPYRLRSECRVFLHPAAPAFHDRSGTLLLHAVLPRLRERATVLVAGRDPGRRNRPQKTNRVTVEYLHDRDHYWSVYDQADVMILPRRYAGLSLPIQEALAAGMPVVTLDLPPYAGRAGVVGVPAHVDQVVRMRGGDFSVHGCRVRALAETMDTLVRDAQQVKSLSYGADRSAAKLDWEQWRAPWARILS